MITNNITNYKLFLYEQFFSFLTFKLIQLPIVILDLLFTLERLIVDFDFFKLKKYIYYNFY